MSSSYVDEQLCLYFWCLSIVAALTVTMKPSIWMRDLVLHGKLVAVSSQIGFLVPKRWFYHFYLFGIFAVLALSKDRGSVGTVCLLVHLLRRLVEELWIFHKSGSSRMHVGAYMFGYLFYTGVALSVPNNPGCISAWIVGNVIEAVSHIQLAHNGFVNPSKNRPPDTLLFRYMNCPHYFAEMLIYVGLASVDKLESIACAVFVIASLSVNWRNHSLWYLEQSYIKNER